MRTVRVNAASKSYDVLIGKNAVEVLGEEAKKLCPGSLKALIVSESNVAPLYLDAVSVAKAGRIREAMALSRRKSVFALKSNALEYESLAGIEGVTRFYESAGAEGLRVHADGQLYEYPALPCIVRSVTGGGDALLAGIVHAGPQASVAESARIGLLCARCAVESPAAVNPEMKNLQL